MEDAALTREHWITDDVIAQNDGEIELRLEGVLRKTSACTFWVQEWLRHLKESSVDPSSVNEFDDLWSIVEGQEWRLRNFPWESVDNF